MKQPDVITYLVGDERTEAMQAWIEANKDDIDRQFKMFLAAQTPIRIPVPCTEDDGYANEDDYVDRMGRYYSSEYVTTNQPWVRELPFHEWLERRQIGEVRQG